LLIAKHLLRKWVDENSDLKLPVTFDNWCTQPAFCRFLDQELELPYVGTLAGDDEVILKRGHLTLEEFVEQLKQEHLQAVAAGGKPVFHKIGMTYKGEKETYYSYCRMDLEDSTPFWRRATQTQSLWTLACFINARLTQGQSLPELMAPLLAAVCY
jgi:hypothetical protein